MSTESMSSTTADVTKGAASSELEEYLAGARRQHRLLPRAALVGLLAGLVAVLFRFLLDVADRMRAEVIEWAHGLGAVGCLVAIAWCAGLAVASVALVIYVAPEIHGSGIPHLKAVLLRLRPLNWGRVVLVKLLGGVLAIGSGLALGREGPTVQMGGAAGEGVARWLRGSTRDRMVLIASGAGAGLAAAFNAPLAGFVFVLEELQRDFRPAVFGAAFLAAATADVLTRLFTGQSPVFNMPDYPVPSLAALPAFALLGCLAGGAGVLFNRCLLATVELMSRVQGRQALMLTAVVGGVTGLLAWNSPLAVGGGHELLELTLEGNVALAAIPVWLLIRVGLTVCSYGTRAPGGIFTPLLVPGALLGLAVGQIVERLFPGLVDNPPVFAVVGMAAGFTAVVRAPLTGIVMILELTGSYHQMLPLLVSCFCSYAVAEVVRDVPIYEALFERSLRHGEAGMVHREPIVVEVEVEPGSRFEGAAVGELKLPAGCLLVRCRLEGRSWVPIPATRLESYTQLTAVIAPEAPGALEILREGCRKRAGGFESESP